MNKIIKETILESLKASFEEARDFMENYENNLTNGMNVINYEIDAKDYEWWSNYRKHLLEAYNEIMKMEVE